MTPHTLATLQREAQSAARRLARSLNLCREAEADTHAGDYSDVRVIDADGREIAWNDVSHLDNDQMRDLMREIVNRLYTFHVSIDDPDFRERVDRWARIAEGWDEPDEDIGFFRKLAEEE